MRLINQVMISVVHLFHVWTISIFIRCLIHRKKCSMMHKNKDFNYGGANSGISREEFMSLEEGGGKYGRNDPMQLRLLN